MPSTQTSIRYVGLSEVYGKWGEQIKHAPISPPLSVVACEVLSR